MKKIFLVISMLLLSSMFVYAQDSKDIIASVNDKPIKKSYISKIANEELSSLPENKRTEEVKNEVVNKIINQQIEEILLIDAAYKSQIEVSKEEVAESVNKIKNRYANEKDFEDDLKKQSMTKEDFEKDVKDSLMKLKYISTEVNNRTHKPTDEEITMFYNNIMSKIKGLDLKLSAQDDKVVTSVAKELNRIYSEQVKIRQIFIKSTDEFTKEQKKEVANRIKELKKELELQDMNFAQLSVKYSDDQVLRQKKGDLGFLLKEDITPEVAKVVFSLEVGSYNKKPVQTANGYHFFRVEEKKAKMPIVLEDIKDYLSDILYKQNIQNEYDKLVIELKSKANIVVY